MITLTDLLYHEYKESAIDRLMSAVREGEHAMHAVAENSGADFQNRAYDLARMFFQKAQRATGEDATDYVVAQGCIPHDGRAFGAVYKRLIADGVIQFAGYAKRRKGHGSPGPVYEARL